jgi:hypothetical protein
VDRDVSSAFQHNGSSRNADNDSFSDSSIVDEIELTDIISSHMHSAGSNGSDKQHQQGNGSPLQLRMKAHAILV